MIADDTQENDNGSGYKDEFAFNKNSKSSFHPLNTLSEDEISKAFSEETGTDESGLGAGDDDTNDTVHVLYV